MYQYIAYRSTNGYIICPKDAKFPPDEHTRPVPTYVYCREFQRLQLISHCNGCPKFYGTHPTNGIICKTDLPIPDKAWLRRFWNEETINNEDKKFY